MAVLRPIQLSVKWELCSVPFLPSLALSVLGVMYIFNNSSAELKSSQGRRNQMHSFSCESKLESPLLAWLKRQGRVQSRTIILREFRWFDRRIDLVTLTCSGTATAYELKLNNNRRAILQAAYNKLVFDRSYVVTVTVPSVPNLKHAQDLGIGIIVLNYECVRVVQPSRATPVYEGLRRQLLRAIKETHDANV